ncbi:MAG: efflux RND transporter periplasmic adaptor subunit [Candidatus Moranbacteria bacterium]|nr:efflux RND transporter periplasmic adaptor subunit [Candidatus Moranbacteria bacterium]
MRRRTWIIIFFLIIVVGFLMYFFLRPSEEIVSTISVQRSTVAQTVSVSGVLEPVRYADLAFEGIGTVEWVGAGIADRVSVGQPLVRLSRSSVLAQLRERQAVLTIAQENLDLARRSWEDLKPEEREAKKQSVSQARAGVDAMYSQLTKLTLISPIDGIVTKQEAQAGEAVQEVGAVVRVIDDSVFQISVYVPESDIVDLFPGQAGVAMFDAFSDEESVPVTLLTIDPEATVIQDVVYYETVFELSDQQERLRSGMSVDVDVVISKKDDVLVLPRRVVRSDDQGDYVLVRGVDGEIARRDVEIGLESDIGDVEVSLGLWEGEEIVDDRSL